jgi:hypothetical protein
MSIENPNSELQLVPANSHQSEHKKSEGTLIEQMLHFEHDLKNDHKQSIKVIARFRPFNKVERELNETYRKNDSLLDFYEDNKTVKIKEDYYSHSSNLMFTFDHVF